MELGRLVSLATELEAAAADGFLSRDTLTQFATDQGIGLREAYAAAAFNPNLRFEQRNDVTFVVCSGGCQQYGALETLGALLSLRERREAEGAASFDIATRTCLDACQEGPVIGVQSLGGSAKIPLATPDKLDETVAQALETLE
jgi:NADH:ubiquinone oxidoreductase subunit E